jgi:hypothetical protein
MSKEMAMKVSLCQIEIVWVFSLPLMFTFSKSGFPWKNQGRRQDKSPFSFREQSLKRWEFPMLNPRSPRNVFNFDQASHLSSESGAVDLLRERRLFEFDEASLNSSQSSIHTTTNSVKTMTEGSNASNATNVSGSGIQVNSSGIYEDHPGLNPSDERVVEYQAAIHEELGKLMIGKDPDEVLAAAERVHADSKELEFLRGQFQDLLENGTASEAFKIGVPHFSESPLDQFFIHPIIPLNIGNYYFSFTNSSLSMLLTLTNQVTNCEN